MMRYLILLFGLCWLAGCTTTVVVEGSVPTPMVQKVPARVAVYYDEAFKTFEHTEALREEGTWKINLGEQNLTFFRNLIEAMFEEVEEVDAPALNDAQREQFDGIIIPSIEKYGFLTPGISGLKFYSASIHYRITMLDADNNKIADWVVVGYGKSEGGAFTGGDALGEATMLAIRDGGARISIDLRQQPAVAAWLEARGGD